MQNLHRIMGSQFVREKPQLCRNCQFFVAEKTDYEFPSCAIKNVKLSAPNEKTKKGRCDEYKPLT